MHTFIQTSSRKAIYCTRSCTNWARVKSPTCSDSKYASARCKACPASCCNHAVSSGKSPPRPHP